MPAILDKLVKKIMKENPDMPESRAWAIATAQLKKQGKLKGGMPKGKK